MVFKLENNGLYILCLRERSYEKIFINSKIFHHTDTKVVEGLANASSSGIVVMPSIKVTLFPNCILLPKIGLTVSTELLKISYIAYLNNFIVVLLSFF